MDEPRVTPVAVIGLACRLPGGIDSPELLWDALMRGDDLITVIPLDRWDADEIYDPEPGVPGRSVCKWGAFIDGHADFDCEFFGISEREAINTDPQQRLLLETSWEAMEHGGLNRATLADTRTGVFMGVTHNDYTMVAAEASALDGPYGFLGNSFSMASGRVAYTLGVHGPALTVDTACSSGLAAVHMACRSLHEGESDLAFAGGVSLQMDSRKAAAGSALGMLSKTGHCHAFDVDADGFVPGEACVVLLLKRLPDAQADGDRILAVLRGTAANQDGHTINIATPSQAAQAAAYRAALAAGGVDPSTVGMVEAHGPGTPIGDPIEYASLAEVYGTEYPCALASVKTNFGHTQSASGVLGLAKAILALQHGEIPRNLHFNKLPDEIAPIETNLFVPVVTTPWPISNGHGTPRRAAVSSYGFSGTNVHVVVEQAPEAPQILETPDVEAPTQGMANPLWFALSASSADALRQTAKRLADWLPEHSDAVALSDLGYTLARRRAHRPVRTAVTAATMEELIAGLREVADGDAPYQAAVGQDDRGPVWVFSGQGSQWAAMGAELLATEPVFAATVAEAEPLIARESGFSVTEAMTSPETVTGIDRVQPTIFTMQVALAATMKSYGVIPGAVIGHSMGESAAAVVAGALSLEDGIKVICRRSKLMLTIAGSAAMASVELPALAVQSELTAQGVDDVVVAVVSSPQSTVVAGSTESIRKLVDAWEQREVMAREVAVDVASHSPQVDPILAELTEVLADLSPQAPQVPYYSATLFDPRERPACDAGYWADNLRHTVRFSAAVRAALDDGYRVFAELSPHPLLTHAVEQTAASIGMPVAALAGMRREQPLPLGLRGLLTDVYAAGAAVDFAIPFPQGRLVDTPLPAWTHRRLYHDADAQQSKGAFSVAVHPLLGSHVQLPEEPERHAWQSDVGTATLPWLGDHQIHNVAALPGAAYCEMALTAARAVLGEGAEARDVRFEAMLLLDEETPISAVATVPSPGVVEFSVEAAVAEGMGHIRRASAVLHARSDDEPPAAHDMAALLAAHTLRVDGEDMRTHFDAHGVQYGPAFTGLGAALIADGTADGTGSSVLAEVALPPSIRSQLNSYGIHPALLDACFQAVAAHPDVRAGLSGGLMLPLGVRRLRAFGTARNACYCYIRDTHTGPAGIEADLDVLDEQGTVLLSVEGLLLGSGATEQGNRNRVLNERLLTIEWQARKLPEPDQTDETSRGPWLLISTAAGADGRDDLADALTAADAQTSTMAWPVRGDHPEADQAAAEALRAQLGAGGPAGVVVLAGPPDSQDSEIAARGGDYVAHVVRIARELTEVDGASPRLYVVTRNAQHVVPEDCPNLEQGGLRGLLRVIGTENPHLRTTHVDVDEQTDVERLARQLLSGADEDETAWRHDNWYTARLTPTALRPEERQTTTVDRATDGMRLQIRNPGDLESMEFVAFDRVPPGPGEIEVSVTASSINFADVLVAFGRYPSFEGHLPQPGTDFAGVVTAVGPDVTDHKVGDHVGGMSPNGCWGTFVTCDANLAATLPEGLTDAQAAAVTTASVTAWYGLNDLARIRTGDKVLIHSATGGVGQAAIAICRAAGAEVYATAGSPERRQLLRDMGIEHVYDSRSIEFAEQIRQDTDGYGVDIVLNSVTGAAQLAGVKLLALGGRFIEIGKKDIYGDTRLGLFPFRRNLAFYGVDVGLMSVSHPAEVRELLNTVYRLTAEGTLPMPQATHYPLAEAATAIRVMSAAEHTGKLILDVPHTGTSSVVLPPDQVRPFRADGSYIITGGLGGLGVFLAEKMAVSGAGRIVLSSRSEPGQKALETIEMIRAIGADVVVECGDIAAAGTADRLVAAATATGLPLRGVLHAAGVVEDATLANITDELLTRDWAPKAFGAWHLHQATLNQPLDWFCSFSSGAALLGSPGQGAYAAANSWLDAFTYWRRAQGLPATSIAWGAWAEVGRATAVAESTGAAIGADEGAYAFEMLLRHDRAYTGYTPIIGVPWLAALAERSKFFEVFQAGQSRGGTSKFRSELDGLPTDEWPARLRQLVSEQVGLILRRTVDPDRPLPEYGLDSLGALELRTRIETETGIRLNPKNITTTVRGLADHLYEQLAPEDAKVVSS
ncbi:sulfolipid-1 biosynthesis phthioceranic/hydroxyphthioceranic acid synthase [Mycobacterium conspicuum]|uniref:sulfolipid-1 biosynthesis phthioceranic/hydroxyphthioceranic acid synthase n=1 Tax=Mycobacterium conspicuum TaxID=44010 RepID=UPI000A26536B|nr:type I polyketide synthase [Mycobacterium conspicuum]ORV40071.1 polyketide synthase [Mycobacterium conspicuum]